MQLWKEIGMWNHRICYEIVDSDLCAKKIKPLTFHIRSLIAHIFRDINQEELKIFNSLPDDLKTYFPDYYEKKNDMLISQRPKDFDGSFSKTLIEYGPIENVYFWESIDIIISLMTKHKLRFFDAFHQGNNIVVQKISEDKYKPIIIDCKRVWWAAYPLQVNLLFNSEKQKKFNRRIVQFKQSFMRWDNISFWFVQ